MFRVQVPKFIPLDEDGAVMAPGGVEIVLVAGLAPLQPDRVLVGRLIAAFVVAVFPGSIAQFVNKRDGFGLNTDTLRFVRLLLQQVLVAWALWSTAVLKFACDGHVDIDPSACGAASRDLVARRRRRASPGRASNRRCPLAPSPLRTASFRPLIRISRLEARASVAAHCAPTQRL